jgi:predicted RNA-binding protein Jag
MKSIIEEASSILKAIEKAWSRAGSPREFSVKIFEDSQKSFFGLTTKQAKVGVFFEIEPLPTDNARQLQTHREEGKHKKHQQPVYTQTAHQAADQVNNKRSIALSASSTPVLTTDVGKEQVLERKKRVAWNDDMLTEVSKWLNALLKTSNMDSSQPTLTVMDNRLIITFEEPLLPELEKTADLYRSLSYLLIGMVRSRFKREFRFLKIVLTDARRSRDNEL